LQAGAADNGVVELVRILAKAGHRPIVASSGGRLADQAKAEGATCLTLDMASRNPLRILGNARALIRIVREHRCVMLHAHGRAPAWSALIAARFSRIPFVTTWYKGFGEQNPFKRFYNSVMARGDRVIAVSDQLAEIINERYGTPYSRIAVIPFTVDTSHFDPEIVSRERIAAVRQAWGVTDNDRVILVVGRMRRRKGHPVVLQAALRLKAMGLKDFVFVFAAEDQGTRPAVELWDQVLANSASDVIRMAGPIDDPPAAYAASMAALSAALQPEGLQRSLLEAQAMARPVIVSDVGVGPEVVLAPPAVASERITGLRFATGDDAALAAVLIRLFAMSETERNAIGERGRTWMLRHFAAETTAKMVLKLYADLATRQNAR
jgi:glycosyltransferase involved in cell wall biosynthesis